MTLVKSNLCPKPLKIRQLSALSYSKLNAALKKEEIGVSKALRERKIPKDTILFSLLCDIKIRGKITQLEKLVKRKIL